VVATPIGNLRDISLRALDVLSACDAIFCEDTRVTRKLLAAFGLSRPLHSYHDHNAARVRPAILKRLEAGEALALVSDAGTPMISDPGFRLAAEVADRGLRVTTLPGPCAAVAALTVSGLPSDRFTFVGFLPSKSAARRRAIEELAAAPGTLIVYESAVRAPAALADLAAVLGPRPAALVRELTKRFEEVRRGSLDTLAAELSDAPPLKGEVVLLVGPGAANDVAVSLDEAEPLLRRALAAASTKDAVASVTAETGLSRRALYALALRLKDEDR
jgi:16S rRNA (cytidine1402-2'-O)-methyltransferase